MTDDESSLNLLEEAKRAIQLLSEAVNSVCYIYDTDFRSNEELHETGIREGVVETVDSLLCDAPYNVRRQCEL